MRKKYKKLILQPLNIYRCNILASSIPKIEKDFTVKTNDYEIEDNWYDDSVISFD